MNYIEPKLKLAVYTCPHCQTISQFSLQENVFQEDINLGISNFGNSQKMESTIYHTFSARCISCANKVLWINDALVYPIVAIFPEPNSEMPTSVLSIYNEAGEICNKSPLGVHVPYSGLQFNCFA